jgi:hypothetical protein
MHVRRCWTSPLTGTVAVLIAFTAAPAVAQTGSVTGTVVEAATRRPIVGAQVFIKGTGLLTQVGEGGRFVLANVPAGARVVGVRQIGFAAGERAVTVTPGGRDTVDFVLAEQAISLNEVVVTGTATATEVRKIGNSVASMNVSDLTEKAPILSVDQLLKGRTAGVIMNVTQSSVGTSGQIKIRGTK